MQKATFTLRFVTPAFIAGADQQQPEIHVPSIRGALRYWLRAAAGGVYGTDEKGLKRVREAEAAVFGSPDRGSPITLWVDEPRLAASAPLAAVGLAQRPVRIPLPGDLVSNTPFTFPNSSYLFWPMSVGEERRKYFQTNVTFKLHLRVHHQVPDQAHQIMEQAKSALWLLTHLGAIGARSRRGAGSIHATVDDSQQAPKVASSTQQTLEFRQFTTPEELRDHLYNGIATIRHLYSTLPNSSDRPAPQSHLRSSESFDVLTHEACSIWVLAPARQPAQQIIGWKKWEDALSAFSQTLREEHKEIRGDPVNPEDAIMLGLPNVLKALGELGEKRRASPLTFRISPLVGSNSYVGVVTLFKARFLSDRADLQPDFDLLERWIERSFHSLPVTL